MKYHMLLMSSQISYLSCNHLPLLNSFSRIFIDHCANDLVIRNLEEMEWTKEKQKLDRKNQHNILKQTTNPSNETKNVFNLHHSDSVSFQANVRLYCFPIIHLILYIIINYYCRMIYYGFMIYIYVSIFDCVSTNWFAIRNANNSLIISYHFRNYFFLQKCN